MGFSDKIIKSRNHLLRIVTGKSGGREAWWILKLLPAKQEIYKIRVKQNEINLGEFGEILQKGWGSEPPENILNFIKAEYS